MIPATAAPHSVSALTERNQPAMTDLIVPAAAASVMSAAVNPDRPHLPANGKCMYCMVPGDAASRHFNCHAALKISARALD